MHNPWSLGDSRLSPFQCYCVYLSLRSHFTSDSYDAFKYRGSVSAKESTFETRKDKYFFMKLSRHRDPIGLLMANILHNPKAWVGTLFNDASAEMRYDEWRKRQESLTYSFKNDLSKLRDDLHENLVVPEGGHPYLFLLVLKKVVSLETLVMLQHEYNFVPYWNKNMCDPLWSEYSRLTVKYLPFLEFDASKIHQIVSNKFSEET